MLTRRQERVLTLLITAVGFTLRLHTIGRDSFWLDEAGQALAVLQPTLGNMIAIERTHAMAMPLDYIVARLFTAFGLAEFALRLPAVLWGVLSLPLFVALARRVADRPTAVLGAFLLAVSPVFVRYSQELRFYAALVAFFLLSALLLVEAFRRRSAGGWVAYSLVTALGVYFHPYAALPALAGGVYALLPGRVTGVDRRTRLAFVAAIAAVGLLFLPGYWLFGAHQAYDFDLLQWGGTLASVTRDGLDWTSFAVATAWPRRLLYGLSVLFALGGAAVALARWRRYPWLPSLMAGVVLGVAGVIVTTWLKGYWYLSRQLLPLAMVTALLTAFGFTRLMAAATRRLAPRAQRTAGGLTLAAAMLVVGLAAAPALAETYALPRSLAREAAGALAEAHARGEPILIMPGFDRQLYFFYLTRPGDFAEAAEHLISVEWEQLPAALPDERPVYLVVRGSLSPERRATLADWGFKTVMGPLPARDGVYELLVLSGGEG